MNIVRYNDTYEALWEKFVNETAVNGTFLQTRAFLNYHPKERFHDCSLIICAQSIHDIYAVIPACEYIENGRKVFYSHAGSTFGGLLVSAKCYHAQNIADILDCLDEWLKENHFEKTTLKITSELFSKNKSDLLQYMLSNHAYEQYTELSTYIDFSTYNTDLLSNFHHRKKRDVNKCLKHLLTGRILEHREIYILYEVLCENLLKYNTKPVHSIDELYDLKERLKENIFFYGIFDGDCMVAGSMLFFFKGTNAYHTQYLCSRQNISEYSPMSYLMYKLIEFAQTAHARYLSFGISTEQKGQILNYGLIKAKEEYGSFYSLNRIFHKTIQAKQLQFEEFTSEYMQKSWDWLNDPETKRLTDTPAFTKTEQLAWFHSLPQKTDYRIWGVSRDGIKIGVVGLKKIANEQAEFFTYIGEKQYWGKGLGTQILLFAEKYAKEELGLKLLTLTVLNENKRAINLYKKYGFSVKHADETHAFMTMEI